MVYAKPPFGGPAVVLKYLARYTHRVAISNRRLVSWADDVVTFSDKDYAARRSDPNAPLSGEEFVRRFVQHVLPRGFVKVRHYGLLANRHREAKLAACRWLLGVVRLTPVAEPAGAQREVQVGHPVSAGHRQSTVAGGTDAPVRLTHDLHPRVGCRQLRQQLKTPVGGAVVRGRRVGTASRPDASPDTTTTGGLRRGCPCRHR